MWPILYQNSDVVVPTYLVINSLTFCLGIVWLYARSKNQGFDRGAVLDVALAVMVGAFVGARTFHIFFEQPKFYATHVSMIFKFWYGGFVFYGGLIGGLALGYFMCRVRHQDFLKVTDLFAPVVSLGTALGRIGCLAAGCCYGHPTTMPWGISFPDGVEAPTGIAVHPTQIYSTVWELCTLALLLKIEKRRSKRSPGRIFGLWLTLHGLGRVIIEQFRGDFRGPEPFNLSVATWLSGLAMIVGVLLVAKAENKVIME